MTLVSESKIREKLSLFEEMVDRKLHKLDEGTVPEDNVPRVILGVGSRSQNVGLYRLALGECEDAVAEFERSAEWYDRGAREIRSRRESLSEDFVGEESLLRHLYSAILAGDDELLERASEVALETDESHYQRVTSTHRYHLMNALVAILTGTEDPRPHLDDLVDTFPELPEEHQRFFGAIETALRGIAERDTDEFYAGIDRLLEWHDEEKVDLENKTSAEDLVCLQATTLIVLARRNGLDVRVTSPYVPECIYEMTEPA